MTRIATIALALLALTASSRAAELITNGSFEQPLTVGWTEDLRQIAGYWYFDWSDTCGQPQPGYVAKVYKELADHAALMQTVEVPDANLTFSFTGRFRIGGGSSTCWPAGAVILRYLDATGTQLGSTKYVLHNEFCTWGNSDTAHIIEVEIPEVWASYNLDVAQEIADNLPGVSAAQVARATVELHSFNSGT